jgi:hypothetical protein
MNVNELPLSKLATILGVSQPFLSQIRAGKRPLPDALKMKVEALGAYHVLITHKHVGVETGGGAAAQVNPVGTNTLERARRFERPTSCLGSKHSTPELRPLTVTNCTILEDKYPFYFPIAPHTLQNNSVQIQYEQWLPLGGGFFYF